jgi:hypothetical protein
MGSSRLTGLMVLGRHVGKACFDLLQPLRLQTVRVDRTSTAIAPAAANVCLAIKHVPMQRRESKSREIDFPALPFPYSIAQDDRINRCYGYGEDFMCESTCPMVKC